MAWKFQSLHLEFAEPIESSLKHIFLSWLTWALAIHSCNIVYTFSFFWHKTTIYSQAVIIQVTVWFNKQRQQSGNVTWSKTFLYDTWCEVKHILRHCERVVQSSWEIKVNAGLCGAEIQPISIYQNVLNTAPIRPNCKEDSCTATVWLDVPQVSFRFLCCLLSNFRACSISFFHICADVCGKKKTGVLVGNVKKNLSGRGLKFLLPLRGTR